MNKYKLFESYVIEILIFYCREREAIVKLKSYIFKGNEKEIVLKIYFIFSTCDFLWKLRLLAIRILVSNKTLMLFYDLWSLIRNVKGHIEINSFIWTQWLQEHHQQNGKIRRALLKVLRNFPGHLSENLLKIWRTILVKVKFLFHVLILAGKHIQQKLWTF